MAFTISLGEKHKMENSLQNQRKIMLSRTTLIKIATAAFFALVVYIIAIFIIDLPKTAKVKILVSPVDSKITLNQEAYSAGEKKIKPGDYKIKIEREGFKTQETEIKISKGDQKYIYYCLTPEDNNKKWFKEHQKDDEVCNQIEQALNEIEKNETMTDPIFSITPYHNDDKRYYIDSILNQDNSITIKIKPLSCKADFKKILKQNALNFLKANKIDLNKYKIEYVEDC